MSSSVAYTYILDIKNVNLLMATIQNTFGKRIDSYNYNEGIAELVISFISALSSEEKSVLDLLTKTFIDSSVLVVDDVLAFRNVRSYKSIDQTVSITLNSLTEVSFQSTSHLDRLYYQMGLSAKFIYIQKPGTYLIIANVGACLDANALPGTNTVLQWSLGTDELRSELTYINILNTNVYTCHTNINNMSDSTIAACVLNVNSATGLNLRLSAKRIMGTSPLVVDNDQTSIQIMSIPGVTYYEGNMTSSVTLSATTSSTINLSSDRIIQYPFAHTIGQPNVTVTQSGKVLVCGKATFNKTSGTDATAGQFYIRINGNPVQDMISYTHVLSFGSMKTTKHIMGVLDVVEGDVISLQAKTTQGTNLQITAAETGLILGFLHYVAIKDLSLTSFRGDVATSVPLTLLPTDLVFTSTLANVGTNIYAGSGYYGVISAGIYLLTSVITVVNPSNIIREFGVYYYVSVDMGKTYYLVPSSLGIKQTNPSGKTSLSSVALINLPVNTRIKVQIATNGVVGDNITTTDGCIMTIINFTDPTFTEISDRNYGAKFAMITSPDLLPVFNATYVEKCRVIRHDLDSGIYRVGSTVTFDTTTPTSINVQLVDMHATSGNSYVVYTKTVTYPAGTFVFSSVDYVPCSGGGHTILMQLSSPNSIRFVSKNALIEIWRAY